MIEDQERFLDLAIQQGMPLNEIVREQKRIMLQAGIAAAATNQSESNRSTPKEGLKGTYTDAMNAFRKEERELKALI